MRFMAITFLYSLLFLFLDYVLFIPKALFGDVVAQPDEAYEVRDGHQAVHGVGEVPDNLERRGGPDEGDQREDDAVSHDGWAGADEIFEGLLAVVFPAQDRREREERQ